MDAPPVLGCASSRGSATRTRGSRQSAGTAGSTLRRRSIHHESLLQRQIITEFARAVTDTSALLFAIPNGERRDPATAAILSGLGVRRGVADLCLVLPGSRVAWIELKLDASPLHRKSYLSDEQRGFRDRVQALGHPYRVVRSLLEFFLVLREFGVPTRFTHPDIALGKASAEAVAPRE